jgi:hypothetical protein
MNDKKYIRRVAIHGITIDGKTYWSSTLIKYIGKKVTVQFIDEDTINVFLESNYLCQAKNRETVHTESLIKKPWRKSSEKILNKVPTCDLVNELVNRSGITKYVAEPYADFSLKIAEKEYKSSGPANILIIID